MPFLPWAPTIGTATSPLSIALGGTGATTAVGAASALSAMYLAANTGVAGYTLVNGTGNILTWTAPNDGAMHRVMLFVSINITSAQTGGVLALGGTLPNGTAFSGTFFGNQSGQHQTSLNWEVQANTTVTFSQNTAQTVGAAVLWADLFAL